MKAWILLLCLCPFPLIQLLNLLLHELRSRLLLRSRQGPYSFLTGKLYKHLSKYRSLSHGNFFVFVDGEEIESVNYENKILAIPYTANTEKIEVYGSYVIPEFGPIAIIILAVAVVSIIVLSRKNSMLLNIANLMHDPKEVDRKNINEIEFDWSA